MNMNPNPNDGPQGMYPPPQSTYAPQAQPTIAPRPVGAPFSFQSLIQSYINVLRNPKVATFDTELPAANWQALWIGAALMGASWVIVSLVASMEYPSAYSTGPSFGAMVAAFVVFFLAFFLATVIYQFVAKLFGGRGTYLSYAYALSLVVVPINVIDAAALIIPVVGFLVIVGLGIYALYLTVLATQSAHALTVGKATAVALTPTAVSFVLMCAFYSIVAVFAVTLLRAAH